MAVIGSGPAGFYTAYKVMAKIENAIIDMYENLPVPYGLVRFGVAPDHPEVKVYMKRLNLMTHVPNLTYLQNCEEKFQEVAQSPNFNFIGNIPIGSGPSSLPLTLLAPHYDAILFAYGASKDRVLGITGEDSLTGIFSARAFVGWYNGLPEYADLNPDLTAGEEAIVVGQGNVALDVARILLSDVDTLRKTDITEAALEALSRNRVKKVRMVGRRGPMQVCCPHCFLEPVVNDTQAAFTIKEARELMKLPSVGFHGIDPSLIPEDISKLPRASKRIMQLLQKGSEASASSAAKSWSLDFKLSPTSFNSVSSSSSQLSSMSFEKTVLEPSVFDLSARARGTGDIVDLPASLAFRSIGYKSEALEGLSELGVPFDDKLGVIPNDQYGRVINPSAGPAGAPGTRHVPGMYCAGWVKRGPTGVIASTMNDAFATADVIAQDWHSHAGFNGSDSGSAKDGWEGIKAEAEKSGCRRVSWQDWEKIDKAEKQRGGEKGKEREKFTRIEDMLAVLD